MVKIAIYSNDIAAASEIETLLLKIAEENSYVMETNLFYNSCIVENNLKQGEAYDIILLDINTNMKEGIPIAQNIREINQNVLIIYISENDSYLSELFKVNTFDFIKRPIQKVKFKLCILRAYEKLCNSRIYFEYKFKNEWIKTAISEIAYFESKGRKIFVLLYNKKTEVFNGKLNEVESQILNKNVTPFLRIHQSYLVNFHFIKRLSKNKVELISGLHLPVSEERYKEISEKYGRLLKEK